MSFQAACLRAGATSAVSLEDFRAAVVLYIASPWRCCVLPSIGHACATFSHRRCRQRDARKYWHLCCVWLSIGHTCATVSHQRCRHRDPMKLWHLYVVSSRMSEGRCYVCRVIGRPLRSGCAIYSFSLGCCVLPSIGYACATFSHRRRRHRHPMK